MQFSPSRRGRQTSTFLTVRLLTEFLDPRDIRHGHVLVANEKAYNRGMEVATARELIFVVSVCVCVYTTMSEVYNKENKASSA